MFQDEREKLREKFFREDESIFIQKTTLEELVMTTVDYLETVGIGIEVLL